MLKTWKQSPEPNSGWQKVKMCLLPRFYSENCLSMFKCA